MKTLKCVAPNKVEEALAFVKAGGRLVVQTQLRTIVVDARCLARFEKAGEWLLKADSEGYRLRSGKGSIYLFPGQLQYEKE